MGLDDIKLEEIPLSDKINPDITLSGQPGIRYYHCRPGTKYEGEHIIYENRFYFQYYKPDTKYVKWARGDYNEIEIGGWIETDDGHFVQVLTMKRLPTVLLVRVPMGTFYVRFFNKKDGSHSIKWQKLHAQLARIYEYRLQETGKIATHAAAVKFVAYTLNGVNIFKAFKLVSGTTKRSTTRYQLKNKVINFMKSDIVRREYGEQISKLHNEFGEELKKHIKLTDLAKEIKKLLDESEKGSKDHRENIEWALKLLAAVNFSEKDNIEDAQFSENDAPPLEP